MTSAELANQIAELLQQILGRGHPAAATTLHDLALACAGQGDDTAAQSLGTAARSVLSQEGPS